MPAAPTEQARWAAVRDRDARQDGAFVYAVRSTGIYCRPSCPSRRPRPEAVSFFDGPAEAEAAGYRACLRCRPGEPHTAEAELAARVCALIRDAEEAPPTLAALGEALGRSPFHLQRVFKRAMGVTPRQYADALRTERLKSALKEGEGIAGALYGAGFGSSSRLYESAGARLGMTPGAYRRGGAGQRIGFAIVDCPLGRLVVAATEKGIAFLGFGDDDARLEGEVRSEFPAAEVVRDEQGLGELVAPIVAHLSGEAPMPRLPLDMQATAFRRRVWEALTSIPMGETRTYSELAAQVGNPRAARAVGSACANNPVSLLVPCHRAVREDGGLGGYRWGLERKRRLLTAEKGRAQGD